MNLRNNDFVLLSAMFFDQVNFFLVYSAARAGSYPESPDHFGTSSTDFREQSHTKNSSTSSSWLRKSRKVQQSPYH